MGTDRMTQIDDGTERARKNGGENASRRRGDGPQPSATGQVRDIRYQVRLAEPGDSEPWLLSPGSHAIGRDHRSAICLTHPTVSRRHAEIEILAEGGVIVRDLGSTNGSWLDSKRIQRVALTGDFDLRVGAVALEFNQQRELPKTARAIDGRAERDAHAARKPTGPRTAMEQMP